MDAYLWLKYLHVAAAVIWVGGGFTLTVVNQRLVRAKDYDTQAALGRQTVQLGMKVFMPASIAVLGFGIWMVAISSAIAFTDLWILMGFGGIAVSVGIGITVNDPTAQRMVEALSAQGPESADYRSALRRLTTANWVELALLFIVIWAMVVKPTL